jgi:hypothetical protein
MLPLTGCFEEEDTAATENVEAFGTNLFIGIEIACSACSSAPRRS